MVSRDDDIGRRGKTEFVERLTQLRQVVVGVLDRRERGRPVDAGRDLQQAVALVMLGAVRIARPEHQHERLVARFQHRKHGLGGDIGEIFLLLDIGDQGARRLAVAGLAVGAARGRGQRQADLGQRVLHRLREWHAGGIASRVIDDDRRLARMIGVIEHHGRPNLADGRGGEALMAGGEQNGVLVDEIAGEMRVDVAEHGVVFDERRHAARGMRGRKADIDRVGEHAGVAEEVAGRHARGIGHGEGREQRMRIGEIDALVAHRRHGGGALRRHREGAQAVRHEQDQVMRRLRGGWPER